MLGHTYKLETNLENPRLASTKVYLEKFQLNNQQQSPSSLSNPHKT